MGKKILRVGLIFFMAYNFISMPAFSEDITIEEKNEREIISMNIKQFFDLLISNDREQITRCVPTNNAEFIDWVEKEIENIQKLSNYYCLSPTIFTYKKINPSYLSVEFVIECKGVDQDNLKDVKRVTAARLFLTKDKDNDAWKINDAEEINRGEDKIELEEVVNEDAVNEEANNQDIE